MAEQKLTIQGMKCDGCVRAVEERLKAVPGVGSVRISLAERSATVEADAGVTREALQAALQGTRFTIA